MTLSKHQCIFCHNLAKLILKINELGFDVKIQELNRTVETQKQYVAEGKSKTMNSKHLDKLAVDLVLFKDIELCPKEDYRIVGEYWESLGGRWGGRFGLEDKPKETRDKEIGWDNPHFEYKEGMC